MSEIIIISAMSDDGVIGAGDGMPWNVPAEYQHFVDTVRGQAVVMGRRSFEIFGADFQAHTFVVTRREHIAGATTCPRFEQALDAARQLNCDIYVAGGRSIYQLGLDVADRMLLSTIKGTYCGDVYFPEFDRSGWTLMSEKDCGPYVLRDWRRKEKAALTDFDRDNAND